MQTGISWQYKNGLFEISMFNNGVELGRLPCGKDQITQLIDALITGFHTIAADASYQPQHSDGFNRNAIPLSRIRLAQNQSSQLMTIVLDVGELELGFSIPTAELTDLGQALQAAGALTAKPN
jgi:hypothetical protein